MKLSKSESNRKYREANKEKIAFSKAAWCERNKEHKKAKAKEWYANNRELTIQRSQEAYYSNHEEGKAKHRKNYVARPADYIRRAMTRQRGLLQATPTWDSELTELVFTEAVHLCKLKEKLCGVKFHVDHIIPLKGKLVCGLHTWNNFQVMPAVENKSKGNKYVI